MENLLAELARYLHRHCAPPAPPAPFPELRLQRRLMAEAWYRPYLTAPPPGALPANPNAAPSPEDVTGRCQWDAASATLTLAAGLFNQTGGCCMYGLALLPDTELTALGSAPPQILPDQPFTFQISRTTAFCIWDTVFAELFLADMPLGLPPFLEARKMIQMDIYPTEARPRAAACVIHLPAIAPLLKPDVFFPGYLIPQVTLREKQVPRVIFQGHDSFRHYFYNLEPDTLLFIHAIPENGAAPLTLYPGDLIDGQYVHPCRIQSYTVVSRPPSRSSDDHSEPPALTAAQARLRPLIQEVIPKDTFFNHFLTAIPSRGDVQQLLHQLPLAHKLKLSLAGIAGHTIDHTSPAFQSLLATRPLTDYGWFLHPSSVPLSLPDRPAQLNLMVLTFDCAQPASDLFQDNLLGSP